jgi:hypothetical protein
VPDALEQTGRVADRARSEFFATVKELGRRRRLAMDIRYQARKHISWVAAAAVVAIAATGAAVVSSIHRSRCRRSRLLRERVAGLMRAWNQPEKIAAPSVKRPGIWLEVAATFALKPLATLAVDRLRSLQGTTHRVRGRVNGGILGHLPTERVGTV